MSEERALSLIVKTTDYLKDITEGLEQDGMAPELLLACLIRATRIYMDKCGIPLDRVTRALETAGN